MAINWIFSLQKYDCKWRTIEIVHICCRIALKTFGANFWAPSRSLSQQPYCCIKIWYCLKYTKFEPWVLLYLISAIILLKPWFSFCNTPIFHWNKLRRKVRDHSLIQLMMCISFPCYLRHVYKFYRELITYIFRILIIQLTRYNYIKFLSNEPPWFKHKKFANTAYELFFPRLVQTHVSKTSKKLQSQIW